jgi:hypothetical protein
LRFKEPSKYIFQCSGFSTGGGCCLRPLGDEICEDLGFDGLPWAKLEVEFARLD